MKPSSSPLRAGLFVPCLLVAGLFSQASAGLIDPLTMNITSVSPGDTIVVITSGGKTVEVDLTVTAAGTPASVANAIAMAVNGQVPGAVAVNGSKLSIVGSADGFLANGIIKATLNSDNFQAVKAVAGILSFDPNPLNGQTTLAADATVTAGFTAGLPTVSFLASAGESIDQLASSLNSSLSGAGYATALIDSHDVEIFGSGALNPTELDFTISPSGTNANLGIFQDIEAVPEPSSMILVATFLFGFGFAALRSQNHHERGSMALAVNLPIK